MKKKFFDELSFMAVNYVIGPVLGISICLLEALTIIRILHYERFPRWEEKLIIVSNHPSLLEPLLLPLMGFPWMNFPWIFSPLWHRVRFSLHWFRELQKEFSLSRKLTIANLPDKGNFYDPLYLRAFKGINVPADRKGSPQERISAVSGTRMILENGGRVLIFPEGTRTFKTRKKDRIRSVNGKELGELKDGAAWFALKTGAKILPVWVEGTDKVLPNNKLPFPRLWHRIIIKIGKPLVLNNSNSIISRKVKKEATKIIAQALLRAADEKG